MRCSCVKNGTRCLNCVPIRLGRCCIEAEGSDDDSCPSSGSSSTMRANGDSFDEEYDPCPLSGPRLGHVLIPVSQQAPDLLVPSLAPSVSLPHSLSPSRSSTTVDLPPFRPSADPQFQWNSLSGKKCIELIDKCYDVAVHWIPNLFKLPHGKSGKLFVRELSLLFRAYAEDSSKECIALKAAFLIPLLVLQKPFRLSKAKDHVTALERRLTLWSDGCFDQLLKEGEAIQKSFCDGSPRTRKVDLADSFSKLMFQERSRLH